MPMADAVAQLRLQLRTRVRWLLAAGCWLLAAGCWLRAIPVRTAARGCIG
jgi:hypothetical protein